MVNDLIQFTSVQSILLWVTDVLNIYCTCRTNVNCTIPPPRTGYLKIFYIPSKQLHFLKLSHSNRVWRMYQVYREITKAKGISVWQKFSPRSWLHISLLPSYRIFRSIRSTFHPTPPQSFCLCLSAVISLLANSKKTAPFSFSTS